MQGLIGYVDFATEEIGIAPEGRRNQRWDLIGHLLDTQNHDLFTTPEPQGFLGFEVIVAIKRQEGEIKVNTEWPLVLVDWEQNTILLLPSKGFRRLIGSYVSFPKQSTKHIELTSWIRPNNTRLNAAGQEVDNLSFQKVTIPVWIKLSSADTRLPISMESLARAVFYDQLVSPHPIFVPRVNWYINLDVRLGRNGWFYAAHQGLATECLGPRLTAAKMRHAALPTRIYVVDDSAYLRLCAPPRLHIAWQPSDPNQDERYAKVELTPKEEAYLRSGGRIDRHPDLARKIVAIQNQPPE